MPVSGARTQLLPGLYDETPDGPRLCASRCELCGRHAFPARGACPRCKRRSMRPAQIGARAQLYSFTVCHAAPAGWRASYLQAYFRLPEGITVFGLVSDTVVPSADALRPGQLMELVVEPVWPGSGQVTCKYRPLEDDDA
jgi:uncharacterized OB-fold protein